MRSFNEFASTKELLEAYDAPVEEWSRIDEYEVAGRMMILFKSTWNRYQVVRDWMPAGQKQGTFQNEDQARQVFEANCRIMDRKWFEPTPPPAGFGRF